MRLKNVLKNNKEVVLAAVKDGGRNFEHADESLKSDKDILVYARL